MEELNSLILLDSNTDIKVVKLGKALPTQYKKEVSEVYIPETKTGYVRLFPTFYELNHKNVVDPSNKSKKLKSRETFTRYSQAAGQTKTEIFTTKEVYFIPLAFKQARQYYPGAYNENERKAPLCQSENGIVPLKNTVANTCNECSYSKWVGNNPPPCNELPVILGLDMTQATISDPSVKQHVTREAFTIQLPKTSNSAVNALKQKLAESILFEDGTYSPIDMTQYIVKMTAEIATDDKGQERTFCTPVFEIFGQVPFEVSEQLLEMLHKQLPEQGNKTPIEMFVGNTEPHTGNPEKTEDQVKEEAKQTTSSKAEKAAPPAVSAATKKPSEEVVEIVQNGISESGAVAPEEPDPVAQFLSNQNTQSTTPAPVTPTPTAPTNLTQISSDDEVVF